jgi:hypothetical protein
VLPANNKVALTFFYLAAQSMDKSRIHIPCTLTTRAAPSVSLVHLEYVPPRDKTFHLDTEAMREKLNERAIVFLMNSKELTERAALEYDAKGLGAFLVRFANAEELCTDPHSVRIQYVEASALTRLNYAYALELVRTYDPRNSFVLMIGVNTGYEDTTYASCIVDSNTEDVIRERVMEEVAAGHMKLAEMELDVA